MKKTRIGIIIAIIMILGIIVSTIASYANDSESIYVNLTPTSNQVGYGIGNPKPSAGGTTGDYIWNINAYTLSDGTTLTDIQRNLYCIRANYSNSWETAENAKPENVVEYNLSYELPGNSNEIATVLDNIEADAAGTLVKSILTAENGQYNKIMWLLDNLYVPDKKENVDQKLFDDFLDKAGIGKNDQGYYNKEIVDGKVYEYDYVVTREDVKAIQKVAIWCFTNGTDFNKIDETNWLNITMDGGESYYALAFAPSIDQTERQQRNEQVNKIYRYLVSEANENATYISQSSTKPPISINEITTSQQNVKLSAERNNEDYLIGPIVIKDDEKLGYNLQIEVKDQKDTILSKTNNDYAYVASDKTTILDENQLIGIDGGFYIRVLRSKLESAKIKVKIEYKTTPKRLWLSGKLNETTGKYELYGEQPLVEVAEDPNELIVELISKPEEFDLALRKYITAVEKVNVDKTTTSKTIENPRNLNTISATPQLQKGTTADYLHRKDPVVVEENDIVTYSIRIYNEGNKAGYASKIIDQLPEGLILASNDGTVQSVAKDGTTIKNTYSLGESTTLTGTNRVVLTILDTAENPAQSLQPYTVADGLDYETIEIKCKVIQKAGTKKDEQIVLTNVAWIAEAYEYDEEQQLYVVSDNDRDSSPTEGNSPNVNKTNMRDYRGITDVNKELSDNQFFYKGQQDDDDFEKLVIMPIVRKFDLALVKFIVAVSDDDLIEDHEYLVEEDGTYSRAPEVKYDSTTGKIEYDFTNRGNKNPLVVEPGDYVLYTIRVYNEGEVDGYASKIKDELPEGLKLVENENYDTKYNGIWEVDQDTLQNNDRIAITTDWYAKGNSYETLLKAFDKEKSISEQNPDYLDAQVLCMVEEQVASDKVLVNYAQITEHTDANDDKTIEDIDSTPDNYRPGDDIDKEDDDDLEKVIVNRFDLSLRKFISSINGVKPEISREPNPDTTPLKNQTDTDAIYNHPKTPLIVQVGDKIEYTIRVYNEGDMNGFSTEIKDYLPPYLKYVDEKESEINSTYKWQISEDGRLATTRYLETTELNAFNGDKLEYADVKIECIVVEGTPSDENQTNIAEISKYKYKSSETEYDSDSKGNSMEELIPTDEKLPAYKEEQINDEYVKGYEDDDDFEKVYVKEFDLSLLKFVSKVIVIEDGKEKITETGYNGHENPEPVVKVELHKKKLNKVTVKFGYGITITNEGDIAGYATEITDYVPEGLRFDPTDNPEWMDEGNNVISTRQLENVLLQPGESKTVEVIFTWINGPENLALKTNTAEISEDKNEYNVPDKDSTPDNKKEGEDDIDIAKVILAVATGSAQTYFMLTLGLLGIIVMGIILIKKFVI